MATALQYTRFLLNATMVGTPNTNDDPRHPDDEITLALQAADGEIVYAILITPGHPERQRFISSPAVAHAGLIPIHIGPIGDVLVNGNAAEYLPKEEIERLRLNPLSLTIIREVYDVSGDPPRLYYAPVAASATVDIATYTQQGAMLQSPDNYLDAVVAQALAFLFGKEGSEVQAAQHYKSLADGFKEWIKLGSQQEPPAMITKAAQA